MRGGSAVYCPACKHRQAVGEVGATVRLPLGVSCEKCGASLLLESNHSGGAHVTIQSPAPR